MLPLFDRTARLPVLLEDALDRGAVVLTANLRAARALETLHAEDQRSRGVTAWPRPRILDWHSWIAELWEQYARNTPNAPVPLTLLQEQQLWKQAQGRDRDRVVAPERMAELAQQAYQLLGSYGAHPLRREAASAAPHEDAERFLEWAESFDRNCRQHGWISRTRLEEQLTLNLGLLAAVPELYLVGFDRITPAQAALLQGLAASGTRVSRDERTPGKPHLLQARDQREELEACAWWCRKQLDEESTRRIGVITPDLGRVRAELDRVFRRILMPQTTFWNNPDGPSEPPLPYEFSLGTSLANLPIARAALALLRWLSTPLPQAEVTWLLTSGFLAASAADHLSLARLDGELRHSRDLCPEVPLGLLLDQPHRHLPADLRNRLRRASERLSNETETRARPSKEGAGRRRASYAHWAELAPSALAEAGWPGYREADSFTFQTQQRWGRLIEELAELGFDGSQPAWHEFLRTLEAQAHSVIFAAESTSPPIQVLGAFESSGQSFDAVWFLGADDSHWPAAGRPHPLLPGWLQRQAGMPHATPDADWLLAQQATARIVGSAPLVILSHPLRDRSIDGSVLRASPLLLQHVASIRPAPVLAAPTLVPVLLDSLEDDSGKLAWPAQQIAGGAEVLKRQAACAFQSFAMRRLQAQPLDEPSQGLDAAERGTRLHAVLEQLWSADPGDPLRLHNQADLRRAQADGSLLTMLDHHISQVFARLHGGHPPDPWTEAYLACEKERLEERLRVWLDCELERRPFTIAALEKQVAALSVGPLRLAVRLDRVDGLADGTHFLIDYKTGNVETSAWMGPRPEEPQLPLYAAFGGIEDVSGVAFAQIRAERTGLLARAADPSTMVSEQLGPASAKTRFDDEVRDEWHGALLELAAQFVRGEASVNPRKGATTCQYCPLSGLCRVHGSRQEDEEEPADA